MKKFCIVFSGLWSKEMTNDVSRQQMMIPIRHSVLYDDDHSFIFGRLSISKERKNECTSHVNVNYIVGKERNSYTLFHLCTKKIDRELTEKKNLTFTVSGLIQE